MAEAAHTHTPNPHHAPEHDASPTPADRQNSCCGGPAPTGTDACCTRDAEMKSTGGPGCGCGSAPEPPTKKTGCCA